MPDRETVLAATAGLTTMTVYAFLTGQLTPEQLASVLDIIGGILDALPSTTLE